MPWKTFDPAVSGFCRPPGTVIGTRRAQSSNEASDSFRPACPDHAAGDDVLPTEGANFQPE
jgi:hypothetical protein